MAADPRTTMEAHEIEAYTSGKRSSDVVTGNRERSRRRTDADGGGGMKGGGVQYGQGSRFEKSDSGDFDG